MSSFQFINFSKEDKKPIHPFIKKSTSTNTNIHRHTKFDTKCMPIFNFPIFYFDEKTVKVFFFFFKAAVVCFRRVIS